MAKSRPIIHFLLSAALLGEPARAFGHAFLDHADPAVGAVLASPPTRIVLFFDSALELAFSGFLVQDAAGGEVARSGAQDAAEPERLFLTLPPLPSGTYRVWWSVVARDGHASEGDFTFTVR